MSCLESHDEPPTSTDSDETPEPEPPDRKRGRVPYGSIVALLNQVCETSYRYDTKATKRLILARWNEGYRTEHFLAVIKDRAAAWLSDADMVQYLRPATLFGTKFEGYLNGRKEARSAGPGIPPTKDRHVEPAEPTAAEKAEVAAMLDKLRGVGKSKYLGS